MGFRAARRHRHKHKVKEEMVQERRVGGPSQAEAQEHAAAMLVAQNKEARGKAVEQARDLQTISDDDDEEEEEEDAP